MLIWLGIILVLTVLLSCIFTPAVFSLLLSIWPDFSYPFSRVYDRVLLVALLFCLFIFRKRLTPGNFLTPFKKGSSKTKFYWIAFGSILSFSFSFIAAFYLLGNGGPLALKEFTGSEMALQLVKTVPAALLIALLEEGVFRVLIFGTLLSRIGVIPAAILSSAIYGVVHFVSPEKSFVYPGFSLTIGFEYLGAVVERVLLPGVLNGVCGLFLIGLVLCTAWRRSKSIYLAVGLHMGWIFMSKLTSTLFKFQVAEGVPSGLGSRYFLVAQPAAWISIAVIGFVVFLICKREERDE